MKILFNTLIERIEIQEIEFERFKKIGLNICIHMRIPGYAPKYALEWLKGMRTEEIEKKNSHFLKMRIRK